MRIATWNINSVRIRMHVLEAFITEYAPDVLCLQEIKVQNGAFPTKAFEDLGYSHQHIHGQRGYHGVATLSKIPLSDPQTHDWCDTGQARHAASTLPGAVELHNFYWPAGGDEPDPEINDKFRHKLDYLDALKPWAAAGLADKRSRIILGDLNIAPLATDVWNHKQLLSVVCHTPIETENYEEVRAAGGFVDAVRQIIPDEEKVFSWWSYRSPNWRKSNRGRRLDHIWLSPDLAPRLKDAQVITDARDGEKPSDHVPVFIDIDL